MSKINNDKKQKLNSSEKTYTALFGSAFAVAGVCTAVYLCTDKEHFRLISFAVLLTCCILLLLFAAKLKKLLMHFVKTKESLESRLQRRAISGLIDGKISEDISEHLPEFSGKLCAAYVLFNSEVNGESVRKILAETFSQIAILHFPEEESCGRQSFVAEFFTNGESIEKTAAKFLNELKLREKTDADIIYGKITDDLKEIADSYRRIKEAALICHKDGCVFDAEKIAARDYSIYNYTIDDEAGIMIYIKKGDFPKAYGLMRNALDAVVYQHGYPIYIIKCFMFELAGTILKAIGEIEKENGVTLGCSKNLNEIFYCDTVSSMELVLKEYLKEVCTLISDSSKVVASPICEKIKKYVRENYSDPDMNVNEIAARFYLNPAYLSNMFKRNTDMKLLDYINKVRVEEAKKLLMANRDISVEELAEKSGFKNSRTFRRTFMKFEEVAPSKFTKK